MKSFPMLFVKNSSSQLWLKRMFQCQSLIHHIQPTHLPTNSYTMINILLINAICFQFGTEWLFDFTYLSLNHTEECVQMMAELPLSLANGVGFLSNETYNRLLDLNVCILPQNSDPSSFGFFITVQGDDLPQLLPFSYIPPMLSFLPISSPSFPSSSITHLVLTFSQKTAPNQFLPFSSLFSPNINPFAKIPPSPPLFFEMSLSYPPSAFSQINNHSSAACFPTPIPPTEPTIHIFRTFQAFPHICYIQHPHNTKINVFRFSGPLGFLP